LDDLDRLRSTRTRLLLLVIAAIGPFALAYGAIQLIVHGDKVVGIVLLAVGALTGALAFRRVLELRTATSTDEGVGDLAGPAFDHLIWVAIGIPLVFAALLVLLLINGCL
jgi:hypothetical protein